MAVVALSSVALAMLLRAVSADAPASRAAAAGAVAGFALFGKLSAAFLAGPILAAAWILRTRARHASSLVATYALCTAGYILFQVARFHAINPPLPRSQNAAVHAGIRSFLDPSWIGSTWKSFWALFGWLTLDLPGGAYLLFAPATAAVLIGAIVQRGTARRRERIILDAGAAGMLALFLVYLGFADWQPQGRYLFPILGCAVAYTATVLQRLTHQTTAEVVLWFCSVSAAAIGVVRLATAY